MHSTRSRKELLERVLCSLDLALTIFEYISWGTLVRLSNANTMFRLCVHRYMELQVLFYLNQFVKTEDIFKLLNLLKKSNAYIMGGIPRCIMADPCMKRLYRAHPPNTLDIVTPLVPGPSEASGKQIRRFLLSLQGYTVLYSGGPEYPHNHTMSMRYRLWNKVNHLTIVLFNY